MHGGLSTMFDVPGFEPPAGRFTMPLMNAVDASYIALMGMRVVAGRGLSDVDNRLGAPPVVVVNEAVAKRFWHGASPIGRCIVLAGRTCAQVVGIVAKASPWASARGGRDAVDIGQMLFPLEAFPDFNTDRTVLVRTAGDPRAVLSRLRSEAQAARGDLPYVDAFPLDDVLEFELKPLRLGWSIFLGLSALALVIAIAGLAVVTAHGVTRRTREMGIRLVLGAEPGDLVRLMARRTLIAMSIGLAAGAGLAYTGAGLLKTVLFGIEPGDPRIFAAATVVLLLVGGIAAWIPARRTGRIDPSAALRLE
jgi:hypothetical protein